MPESDFSLYPVWEISAQLSAITYGVSRLFLIVFHNMEMRRRVFVGVDFNLVAMDNIKPDPRLDDIHLAVIFLNIVIG